MSEKIRRWVAAGTLAVFAGAEGWTALQWEGVGSLQLIFGAFGAALFVAGVGVFFRMMWARWIGLAAGLTGLCNAAVFYAWFGGWTYEAAFFAAMSSVLLAALCGRGMARHFATRLKPQSVFHRQNLRVELIGAAVVTGIAAISILVLFGALVPAAFVGLGVLATMRERALGVPLLGIGGVMALATQGTGLAFPVLALAASCGVGATAVLARPMLAFARDH